MAYSIPCIAMSTLLSKDIFADGQAAALYERNNVLDLVLCIKRMVNDEDYRCEIVENALELFGKELSTKRFSEHMMHLLKALPKK